MSFEHITKISDLTQDTMIAVIATDDPKKFQALLKHLAQIGTSEDRADPVLDLLITAVERAVYLPYGLEAILKPMGEGDKQTTLGLQALDAEKVPNADALLCTATFNIAYLNFVIASQRLSSTINKKNLQAKAELEQNPDMSETEKNDKGFTVEIEQMETRDTLTQEQRIRLEPPFNIPLRGKCIVMQRGMDRPPVSQRSLIVGMSTSRLPDSKKIMSAMPETTRDTPQSRCPPGSPDALPLPLIVRQSGYVPAGTSDQAAPPPPSSVPLPSHRVMSLGPTAPASSTPRPQVPRPTPRGKKQA